MIKNHPDDVISDLNDVTADAGWEVYERVSGRGCPGGVVSNFGSLGGGLIIGGPGRETGGKLFFSQTSHLHYFAARWRCQELLFFSAWIGLIMQFYHVWIHSFLPPFTRGER